MPLKDKPIINGKETTWDKIESDLETYRVLYQTAKNGVAEPDATTHVDKFDESICLALRNVSVVKKEIQRQNNKRPSNAEKSSLRQLLRTAHGSVQLAYNDYHFKVKPEIKRLTPQTTAITPAPKEVENKITNALLKSKSNSDSNKRTSLNSSTSFIDNELKKDLKAATDTERQLEEQAKNINSEIKTDATAINNVNYSLTSQAEDEKLFKKFLEEHPEVLTDDPVNVQENVENNNNNNQTTTTPLEINTNSSIATEVKKPISHIEEDIEPFKKTAAKETSNKKGADELIDIHEHESLDHIPEKFKNLRNIAAGIKEKETYGKMIKESLRNAKNRGVKQIKKARKTITDLAAQVKNKTVALKERLNERLKKNPKPDRFKEEVPPEIPVPVVDSTTNTKAKPLQVLQQIRDRLSQYHPINTIKNLAASVKNKTAELKEKLSERVKSKAEPVDKLETTNPVIDRLSDTFEDDKRAFDSKHASTSSSDTETSSTSSESESTHTSVASDPIVEATHAEAAPKETKKEKSSFQPISAMRGLVNRFNKKQEEKNDVGTLVTKLYKEAEEFRSIIETYAVNNESIQKTYTSIETLLAKLLPLYEDIVASKSLTNKKLQEVKQIKKELKVLQSQRLDLAPKPLVELSEQTAELLRDAKRFKREKVDHYAANTANKKLREDYKKLEQDINDLNNDINRDRKKLIAKNYKNIPEYKLTNGVLKDFIDKFNKLSNDFAALPKSADTRPQDKTNFINKLEAESQKILKDAQKFREYLEPYISRNKEPETLATEVNGLIDGLRSLQDELENPQKPVDRYEDYQAEMDSLKTSLNEFKSRKFDRRPKNLIDLDIAVETLSTNVNNHQPTVDATVNNTLNNTNIREPFAKLQRNVKSLQSDLVKLSKEWKGKDTAAITAKTATQQTALETERTKLNTELLRIQGIEADLRPQNKIDLEDLQALATTINDNITTAITNLENELADGTKPSTMNNEMVLMKLQQEKTLFAGIIQTLRDVDPTSGTFTNELKELGPLVKASEENLKRLQFLIDNADTYNAEQREHLNDLIKQRPWEALRPEERDRVKGRASFEHFDLSIKYIESKVEAARNSTDPSEINQLREKSIRLYQQLRAYQLYLNGLTSVPYNNPTLNTDRRLAVIHDHKDKLTKNFAILEDLLTDNNKLGPKATVTGEMYSMSDQSQVVIPNANESLNNAINRILKAEFYAKNTAGEYVDANDNPIADALPDEEKAKLYTLKKTSATEKDAFYQRLGNEEIGSNNSTPSFGNGARINRMAFKTSNGQFDANLLTLQRMKEFRPRLLLSDGHDKKPELRYVTEIIGGGIPDAKREGKLNMPDIRVMAATVAMIDEMRRTSPDPFAPITLTKLFSRIANGDQYVDAALLYQDYLKKYGDDSLTIKDASGVEFSFYTRKMQSMFKDSRINQFRDTLAKHQQLFGNVGHSAAALKKEKLSKVETSTSLKLT